MSKTWKKIHHHHICQQNPKLASSSGTHAWKKLHLSPTRAITGINYFGDLTKSCSYQNCFLGDPPECAVFKSNVFGKVAKISLKTMNSCRFFQNQLIFFSDCRMHGGKVNTDHIKCFQEDLIAHQELRTILI